MKLQNKSTKVIFPQWLAGIGATLLLIHAGIMGGWASPTLAQLTRPDSPIFLDAEQASWVASLVNFGRFFGGILGPVSVSWLGSKRSILVTLLPIAAGWFLVAIAQTVEWLYASRVLSGIGLGMAFGTFPLYLGEVAMPEVRGALISLATVGAPFGQVLASVCSSYLSISVASSVYLALALLLMLVFAWLPESPHHLVKVGRRGDAQAAISWYRSGRGVDEELVSVEKFVETNEAEGLGQKLASLVSGPTKRATLQIIVLFACTQLGGLNIILFFMESILKRARFNLVEPALLVIYVNACSMLAAGLSILLIDRCGRKFLLLVASSGQSLSMLGLMSHFMLMGGGVGPIQWLPASCVLLFMVSFFLGMMPAPNAILSETFPANLKCVAACVAILVAAIVSFVSAITYQPLLDLVGDAYVFMIYALLSALIIPYTLLVVKETKGKTLQQIQDELIEEN